MFVSRVAVSLRIPGLEKMSLVKIVSLVYNSRVHDRSLYYGQIGSRVERDYCRQGS